MRAAGFSDKKISKLPWDARLLWAYSFDVALLRKREFSVDSLLKAGKKELELLSAWPRD